MMNFKRAFDSLEWVYIMNILAQEKRQQKKEWKKRKRKAKRAVSETSVKIANGVTAKPRDQEKTASVSHEPTHPSPQNGIKCTHHYFLKGS